MLVYDRVLKAEEVSAINRYFTAKYAATVFIAPARPEKVAGSAPLVAVQNPPMIQPLVPGFSARKMPVSLRNINCLSYHQDGLRRALLPHAKAEQLATQPHNEELPQLAGADRNNGKVLFSALCATCHPMRNEGA